MPLPAYKNPNWLIQYTCLALNAIHAIVECARESPRGYKFIPTTQRLTAEILKVITR